jgi:hypothetical protein
MTRTILIAAASAIALAGCATPRGGARSYSAPGPTNIDVIFNNNNPDCADRKAYLVVDQEPIYYFRPSGIPQQIHIIWHLRTKGYKFAKPIDNPKPHKPGSPQDEIDQCAVTGNQVMQCRNKGSSGGTWKYTLDNIVADGADCPNVKIPDLDPTIGND